MRTRAISLAVAVLAVALTAVGCGGGSDESSTSSISKAAFIKKTDGVCKRGNSRMEVAFAHFLQANINAKPSKAEYEALVGKVLVPNVKREIKEIRAFGAPSGDEDRVDDFLETLEEGIEVAERNPKAVVNSSEVIFGIPSRLAREYGLEVCGTR